MSPDNTNDPNDAPDFSSVPLPEENPIRSPYAPATGTLGEIADDLTNSPTPSAPPTPTGAFVVPEPDTTAPASAPETPTASAPTSDSTIPTAGTLGAQEEAFMPGVASEKVQGYVPDPNAPAKKGKGKLIAVICGGLVLVAAVVLGVIFIPKLINNNGGGVGGNGHTGPLFTANAFTAKDFTYSFDTVPDYGYTMDHPGEVRTIQVVNISESGKKLLFTKDGKKIGADKYDYVGDFIDGAALAKLNNQYAIINDAGEEVVKFGEYPEIVEYGGLYGVTQSGDKNKLIDGTGRTVVEYTDQFDNYASMEANGRAAYTLFSLGSGKYDVYSARGEKLTTIEAGESTPYISSNNLTGDNSVTTIFYDGKLIIYGDSSNEIKRLDNVSRQKMFIKDADVKNGVYLFSTATETPYDASDNIDIPTDKRSHAVVIKDSYKDITSDSCPLVTYERKDNGNGTLICHVTKSNRRFIDSTGSVTAYDISSNTLSNSGTGAYGSVRLYPTSVGNYIKQADDYNGYSIYVDDKPVKTFLDERSTSGAKSYAALGPSHSKMEDDYPYYIVAQYSTSSASFSSFYNKYLLDASIYDTNGEKVCSLDVDNVMKKYDVEYFSGFDSNGIAIIGNLMQRTLIDKNCEPILDRSYYSIMRVGRFYSAVNYNTKERYYYNTKGELVKEIGNAYSKPLTNSINSNVGVLSSDLYITVADKVAGKASSDTNNIESDDNYVAFMMGEGDTRKITYFSAKDATKFYEVEISASTSDSSSPKGN